MAAFKTQQEILWCFPVIGDNSKLSTDKLQINSISITVTTSKLSDCTARNVTANIFTNEFSQSVEMLAWARTVRWNSASEIFHVNESQSNERVSEQRALKPPYISWNILLELCSINLTCMPTQQPQGTQFYQILHVGIFQKRYVINFWRAQHISVIILCSATTSPINRTGS